MSMTATFGSAARALTRRPGYACLAIATVALAIAANTTLFSIVQGALLKPLPYADAERLVAVDVRASTGYTISSSIPNYRDFRDRAQVFDAYAGSAGWSLIMTGRGNAEVLDSRAVLGDFFPALGIQALHGRVFDGSAALDRDAAGAANFVVLGHAVWRDRFGADPNLIGQTLMLSRRPYTVVGILPPGVGYPRPDVQAYVPMASIPNLNWDDRDSGFGTEVFARLQPGVTLDIARQDMARVGREMQAAVGETASVPELRTLTEYFLGDLDQQLTVLMAAVVFVLLIAVANLGNLLLARGEERHKELAVRAALGAGPGRLRSLLLAEALWLAGVGGLLGAALAWAAIQVLVPLLPPDIPLIVRDQIGVDVRTLGFGIALALLAGVAFGLLPAWRAARVDLAESFKSGSRAVTAGRGGLRTGLVVTEIAFALLLLVGAGLMLKSLDRLNRVDKGFATESLLTVGVAPTPTRVADMPSWVAYYAEVRERAAVLPGVTDAAVALILPLSNRSWELRIHPAGRPVEDATADSVLYNIVSPEYFRTLEVPILRGRSFGPEDREGTQPVTVIDETMAALYWPGQEPLGRQVTFGQDADGQPVYRTVIGVTRNVRHYDITQPSRIQAYVPLAQTGRRSGVTLRLVLRTDGDPTALLAPLRATVMAFDAEAPVFAVNTMESFLDGALGRQRAMTTVLTTFAAAALALAGLGIFGVMSYTIAQRTREIGIRVALGATRARILGWVGRDALRMTVAGIALGTLGAWGATRALSGVLYEVDPLDPLVFGAMVSLLGVAAALAAFLPARRAAAVDPATVLADEG
jgi:putative ABC transport system permease protein